MNGLCGIDTNSQAIDSNEAKRLLNDKKSDQMKIIKEGLATIYFTNQVFYNPVQQFNRDLSSIVLGVWCKNWQKAGKIEFSILEALSATGLRALRYAKEIDGLSKLIANDFNAKAVEAIAENIQRNGVGAIAQANHGDALDVMYKVRSDNRKKFSAIDLDPFGSAAPFFDAAVQAIAENGLLCITCTDMTVLAGNLNPEKAFALYGGISNRVPYCHELALRLVLFALASSAARYGRCIEPQLSLSVDFYVRLFVKVYKSPIRVKDNAVKSFMNFYCRKCNSWFNHYLAKKDKNRATSYHTSQLGEDFSSNCKFCGHKLQMAGPFWGGSLHNREFIDQILNHRFSKDTYKTLDRVVGMLNLAREELDEPFYYNQHKLFSVFGSSCVKATKFKSALVNQGYHVSLSHALPTSLKTDAPPSFIFSLVKSLSNRTKNNFKDEYKSRLFNSVDFIDINDEFNPKVIPKSFAEKLNRYQINPLPNWGPGSKPKTQKD